MAKVKKAQVGMTMKQLKRKYPDVDTMPSGDVRGSEMNAYAPRKEVKKYSDTYDAFERKYKGGPARDVAPKKKKSKAGSVVKKAKVGTKMSKMSKVSKMMSKTSKKK